jgi:DNA polymerase-3 subunit alpha
MADYHKFDPAPEGTPVAGFVHLHVHSDYSLLDSCATLDKLVAKAKRLNMPALALTDHGNMFGALNFEKLCHVNGINPIVGEEFYVAYGSHTEKNDVPFAKGNGHKAHYFHLILLCENQLGYENMSWLSSRAFCDENAIYYGKPRIDFEMLKERHEGLICLSACIQGEIPQYLLSGRTEEAYKIAREYKELFGPDHFYIELQDHGIPEQKIVAEKLIKLARDLDIPMVVTNDIHYVEKEDAEAQDALRCIGFKNIMTEPHQKMGGDMDLDNWYFKTEQEMRLLFPELPEAYANTIKIANMCNLTIKQYSTPELKGCLPRFELPAEFRTHGDDYQSDQNDYVKYLVEEGLKKRYKEITPEIRERADYEMNTIFTMGFSGYFLIVWEFIHWSKSLTDNVHNCPKHYIPIGPGRGSGAGSLVAYCMEITDLDPFRYGLIFERFLNPERVSMPDFDVDMDFDFRQEIIQHTRDLYGDECVGHIVTFGTLKPKNCITDVGRVLNIPLAEVNMLKKGIPDDDLKITLKDTLSEPTEKHPKGGGLIPYKDDPRYKKLFELALKLEGVKRNTGLHASGMVIGLTPLPDWAPVFKDPKTGEVGVQYTMDIIEPCGLVKFDYLGLKTLSLIRYTEDIVNKHRKPGEPEFKTEDVSESDAETFKMLSNGDSVAIFQFESPGMQKILKQFQPEKLEDLVALNALYRPGPMDCIPQYIEGKWKPETIHYPDPSLEGLLKETYGVMVYQEQVMKVAQIIAGFTLGGADMLRRAMGKKKMDVLMGKKKEFEEGAMKNGYTKEHADEIFDIMIPFAGYGFNKSHAAAYSVLAYRTAWLKCHKPAEFMAANLTNEITSTDTLPVYIQEARRMGIPVDPPDVNRSDIYFDVVDGHIVFGLKGIKGVGESAAQCVVDERAKNGPYKDFLDFLERVDTKTVNKRALEVLIKTGAFDSLGQNRPTLLQNMERAVSYIDQMKKSKEEGASLFEAVGEKEFSDFVFEEVEDLPKMEKLNQEKECIGIYVSGHPLDDYRKVIESCATLTSANLEREATAAKAYLESVPEGDRWKRRNSGKAYVAIGMISELKPYRTKKGDDMCFGKIQDLTGFLEVTFFAKTWGVVRAQLSEGKVVALKGTLDASRESPSFLVDELLDIATLQERSIQQVHIQLEDQFCDEKRIQDLRDLLLAKQGNCVLYFHVNTAQGPYIVKGNNQARVPCDKEFLKELEMMNGVKEVWTY